MNEGIAGGVMTEARDFYVTEFTLNGGAFAADAEVRFREGFKDKLRPEQVDRLVAWARRFHGLEGGE